jgi:tetratricopeptide (TPR) repeat protein
VKRGADCREASALLARVRRSGALDLVLGPAVPTEPYWSANHAGSDGSSRVWLPNLYLTLGNLSRTEGDFDTASRALRRAADEIPTHGKLHIPVLAGIMLGLTHVQHGDKDLALRVTLSYARLAKQHNDALWSFALMVLGLVFQGVDERKAVPLLTASLATPARPLYELLRAEAKIALALCLSRRGQLRRAYALALEALDEVRKVGPGVNHRSREAATLGMVGLVCLRSDLGLATRHAEEGLRIIKTDAPGHERVRVLFARAAIAMASPTWTDAGPFFEAALEIDASLQGGGYRRPLRRLAAKFMARAQRVDEAVAQLESLIVPEPTGRIGAQVDCELRLDLTRYLDLLGRNDAARDQLCTATQLLSRFKLQGNRALLARARRLHARLGTTVAQS